MTLEGCVVRISDIIAYIGRDIDDAVRLGVFKREQIPESIKKVFGDRNHKIIETITFDIVNNSYGKPYIKMSDEVYKALAELKQLGDIYGFDISRPAANAQEAIQWMYLGYLAAVKEQNGAAMSLGRTSTFIDIYIQRDLERGLITEEQAQEYIDHFIMKLRLVKFARTPEYNALFSGDPTWVTESIGGVGVDGRPLVTKTSFRYLHTLDNLGTAPEPNLTVLWSTRLPHHPQSADAALRRASP